MNFKKLQSLLIESIDIIVDNSQFYIKRISNTHGDDYILYFKHKAYIDGKKITSIKFNNNSSKMYLIFEDGSVRHVNIVDTKIDDILIKAAIKATIKKMYEEPQEVLDR